MSPYRLLIVSTVSSTIRAFLLPFAEHFRDKGWRVDAAANNIANDSVCRCAFDSCYEMRWNRHIDSLPAACGSIRTIQQLVTTNGYDIVHVHTPIAAFVTRFALRQTRKSSHTRVIYTAHGFHFYPGGKLSRNLVFGSLEKLAGRWTDYLITINAVDTDAATAYKLVSPECLVHMPGIGVDTTRLAPEQVSNEEVMSFRQEIRLQEDDDLFLMVAEFIPRKRHQDLLRALSTIPNSRVHLAFAGDGPLLKDMQSLASSLNVQERTHFLGFRKDVPRLIRAATATVLPSEQEGLPRSVMESLSLAVPVIGTSIRGTRELLNSGSGVLVPVGDTAEIASAMAWMIGHKREREQMGRTGRAAMEQFSIERLLLLHDQLYSKALAQ